MPGSASCPVWKCPRTANRPVDAGPLCSNHQSHSLPLDYGLVMQSRIRGIGLNAADIPARSPVRKVRSNREPRGVCALGKRIPDLLLERVSALARLKPWDFVRLPGVTEGAAAIDSRRFGIVREGSTHLPAAARLLPGSAQTLLIGRAGFLAGAPRTMSFNVAPMPSKKVFTSASISSSRFSGTGMP